MQRIKILTWEKVYLVVPEEQDIEVWYKWVNDIENQSFLWTMFWNIITYKNEKEYFENLNKDDKQLTFSIYVENIKKTIWNISLLNIDYKNSHCELWIAVFDKENQDKWYWSEAIKLIQKYAFEVLWLNKLYLRYISSNPRAWHVYSKLWFVEIWIMKQQEYRFWEYFDVVIMEILREEYLSTKK